MTCRFRLMHLTLAAAFLSACFPIAVDEDGSGAEEVACFGGAESCYSQTTTETCAWLSGCDWNHYWDVCEGTQKRCTAFDVRDHCLTQAGCFWQDEDGMVEAAHGPSSTSKPIGTGGSAGTAGGKGGSGGAPGTPPGTPPGKGGAGGG